jgi:hypothetical protein
MTTGQEYGAQRGMKMVKVSVTFGNLRKGFVSAWDAAKAYYGDDVFSRMCYADQVQAVRDYVNR